MSNELIKYFNGLNFDSLYERETPIAVMKHHDQHMEGVYSFGELESMSIMVGSSTEAGRQAWR